MLFVQIWIWPSGDRAKARLLQELAIANVSTNFDATEGAYTAVLSHSSTFKPEHGGSLALDPATNKAKPEAVWRKANGIRHKRNLSPAHLVRAALKALF